MFVAGSGADQSGFANCRVADEHTFYEFLVWLFVIHVAITEAAAEWTFWNDWKVKRKFICRSDNKNLLSVECSGDWIGRVAKRNQFIRPEIELNAIIRIVQGKRHKLRASLWIKKFNWTSLLNFHYMLTMLTKFMGGPAIGALVNIIELSFVVPRERIESIKFSRSV